MAPILILAFTTKWYGILSRVVNEGIKNQYFGIVTSLILSCE